jgi:prepilin-type N-terminal cleavage/methylation domain-containing protein
MLIHPHLHHRRAGRRFASGLTLIELLVVLIILAALAGVVLPHMNDLRIGSFGTRGESPQEIATKTTLLRVRAAIMGDESMPGLWQDLGGRETELPWSIAELFVARAGWPTPPNFDPNTGILWRGPYLMSSGARYGSNDDYGTISDPAVLDGWGRPIIIQGPKNPLLSPTPQPEALYIRLVSRGEDGVLNTTFNELDLQSFVNLPTLAKGPGRSSKPLMFPAPRAPHEPALHGLDAAT